jgi:hypothetical protein
VIETHEHAGEFNKSGQLFIRPDNETLPVAAVCVSNPDRSPVGIHYCNAAPTPLGFAELDCGWLLLDNLV